MTRPSKIKEFLFFVGILVIWYFAVLCRLYIILGIISLFI